MEGKEKLQKLHFPQCNSVVWFQTHLLCPRLFIYIGLFSQPLKSTLQTTKILFHRFKSWGFWLLHVQNQLANTVQTAHQWCFQHILQLKSNGSTARSPAMLLLRSVLSSSHADTIAGWQGRSLCKVSINETLWEGGRAGGCGQVGRLSSK